LNPVLTGGADFSGRRTLAEATRFNWWPGPGDQPTLGLDVHQLQLLLWNGNPASAQAAPMWRAIAPAA